MSEEAATQPSTKRRSPTSPKKAVGRVFINKERCKGCGFCVEFCPLNVLVMSSKFNAKGYHYPEVADGTKCSGCDLCGMYCPDFAVYGSRQPAKE